MRRGGGKKVGSYSLLNVSYLSFLLSIYRGAPHDDDALSSLLLLLKQTNGSNSAPEPEVSFKIVSH